LFGFFFRQQTENNQSKYFWDFSFFWHLPCAWIHSFIHSWVSGFLLAILMVPVNHSHRPSSSLSRRIRPATAPLTLASPKILHSKWNWKCYVLTLVVTNKIYMN
jgi:hypothetical protein